VNQAPFAELAGLDRLIHDPSRLAILSALLGCAEADFKYLLAATGLSKGNLSSHLSKLEEANLVLVTKGFEGKVPWTRVRLAPAGRARVEAHWRNLEAFRSKTTKVGAAS
jgi:DNA-binding transcriptional ArsR family regulator